jgi:VCBS repeat-containing protein
VFTYTPNANFNGADSFVVTVTDKAGDTATQTVTVNVAAVNDAPVAVADAEVSVVVGNAVLIDVVANDTDVEGSAVTLTGTPSATQGVVSISGGKLSYIAPVNYTGPVTIAYTITDGTAMVAASQSVVVSQPTITAAAASVNEGATAVFNVKGAPNTVYTVALAGSAAVGVDHNGSALQNVTTNASGIGVLTLAVTNDKLTETTESIIASLMGYNTPSASINVIDTSVNNVAPVFAATAAQTTAEDTSVSFVVAASDANAEDTVSYAVTSATNGSATINPTTGAVSFTPAANFNGTATVVVSATDGAATTSQTVSIAVTPVNDAPTVAATQTVAGTEDTAATVTVVGADVDAGDVLSYKAGTAGNGTVTGGTGGVFTYTPNANFNGADSFVVTVTDKAGDTATQTVTVNVAAVNDAPVITSGGTGSVNENAAVATVIYTASATDVDAADTLLFSIKAGVGDAGSVGINPNTGAVTLNSSANFEIKSTYSFTVVATDAGGLMAEKSVTVAVGNVNDAPVATADSANALTGQLTTINVLSNDTDEDGNALTITAVTSPTKGGTASINAGKIDFTSAQGFAGTDTFTYTVSDGTATSTATVTVSVASNTGGTSGNDLLFGTSAAEAIDGLAGNDTINGGGGLDTLVGGEGDDRVIFSDGASQILGGNGVDTLLINANPVASTFDLSSATQQNTDTNSLNSLNTRVVVRGFENLDATDGSNAITLAAVATGTTSIITGSQGDTITSLANATGAVTVATNGGNDTITTGAMAAGSSANINAGEGNDTISAVAIVTTAATTLIGGAGNDTVTGGSGANVIQGDAGTDSLTGGAAADTITGGAGNDTLVGNAGANSLDGGEDNDSIAGGANADTIVGGTGNDTITGGGGADSISTNEGNDRITLADLTSTVNGGSDTDVIVLTAGTNVADNDLVRLSGVEQIDLSVGQSTLTMGANANASTLSTVTFGGANDSINASNAAYTLNLSVDVGNGTNSVVGGAGADTITLGTGADSVDTGAGDDRVVGGANVTAGDTLTGGSGTDTLTLTGGGVTGTDGGTYSGAGSLSFGASFTTFESIVLGTGLAVVDAATGNDTAGSTQDYVLTLAAANVAPGAVLTVDASALVSRVTGLGGDSVVGGTGSTGGVANSDTTTDETLTLDANLLINTNSGAISVIGGAAGDSVLGSANADTVAGNEGNDTIDGNGGADSLLGGNGNDQFNSSVADLAGAARLDGGANGTAGDVISLDTGSTLSDSAFGNVSGIEVLTLNGGGSNSATISTLAEAAGVRTVNAGAGGDSISATGYVSNGVALNGGIGADTLTGSAQADTIAGGLGNDSLVGGAGADSITTAGNDTVTGGNDNDTITLGTGADSVDTGAGDDRVVGGANVTAGDTLTGGSGTDTLTLTGGGVTGTDGGTYSGAGSLSFGASFTTFESIVLGTGLAVVDAATGNDTAGSTQDYVLTLAAANVAPGAVLTVDASALVSRVTGLGGDSVVGGTGSTGGVANSDTTTDETLTLDANLLINTNSGAISVIGGAAGDSVLGSANADTIFGNGGADTLNGGAGNNSVDGGEGNDTITTAGGNDNVAAGNGNNTVTTGDGTDTITAGSGNDTITAGGGADRITSGTGNDLIILSALADGGDTITDFTTGSDVLQIALTADGTTNPLNVSGFLVVGSFTDGLLSLDGTTGSPRIGDSFYNTADGRLYVDNNGDGQMNSSLDIIVTMASVTATDLAFNITGTTQAEAITGGAGSDTLNGGAGTDTLVGGNGADSLTAGAGADSLSGGAGADTYALGAGGDADTVAENGTAVAKTGVNITGFDIITGFVAGGAEDVLTFVGTNAKQLAGTYTALTGVFVVGAAVGDNDVIVWADTNNDNVVDAGELAVVLVGVGAAGAAVDVNGGVAGNGP